MELALSLPGLSGTPIQILAPTGVPTGGLSTTGQDALQLLTSLFFIAAIIIALVVLIWAGMKMITEGDKKENVAKVKTMLTFSVIGLALVFIAILIIRTIGYFFGVPLLP